ncbi:hypothetical protein ACPBEI_11595 [Latilactobacillus sakei]
MSKEKRAEQIERANVYPNKLEDILADIEKIESKYSLRPRQFESLVQFSHRYLQKKTALTEHSIFTGLTFHGKPVSKEEYTNHYEEYVKRCSDVKEANSLADVISDIEIKPEVIL